MLRRRKGFTLIDMLIVLVVIALLALIVIPRLIGAGQKAKEAALKADLLMLRNAIQQFEADCGDYPAALVDLETAPAVGSTGGTGITLDVEEDWQGPYLRTSDGNLPNDSFTGVADWTYDPATGDVHSSSTMTSPFNGEKYSNW